MKKVNYLLLFLLLSLILPLTGQSTNVNDPNKETLSQLKNVREMIMRSNNPAFKAKALKQMNEQMDELLFNQQSETEKKYTFTNKKRTDQENGQKIFYDYQTLQNNLKSSKPASYNKKMRIPVAGVMKYKLDSLIFYEKEGLEWTPQDKQEFTYDYNTKITSNNIYEYDKSLSLWQDDEKMTITYNDAGQMTMYHYQWWNDELQRWIDEHKYTIDYNTNGDVVKEEVVREDFDPDSLKFIKRGEYKHEYFFDSNNNETSNVYYVWNYQEGDWMPDSKNEYWFEDGYELMFAAYQWDNESKKWIGHWKFEHQKVPGFDLLGSIYYNWNLETDSWFIRDKTVFEVSSENGVTVTATHWEIDYQTGNLMLESKSVYTNQQRNSHDLYDGFKNTVNYIWNLSDGNWQFYSKRENTYDSFDNITLRIDSIYRYTGDEGFKWFVELMIESNVNAEGLITDYTVTNWHFNGISNTLTEKSRTLYTFNDKNEIIVDLLQRWDFVNEVWKNASRNEFEYNSSGQLTTQIYYNVYNPDNQQWSVYRRVEFDYNADGSQALNAYYELNPETQNLYLTYKTENRIDAYGETILEQNIQWNSYLKQEVINYKREKIYDEQRNLLSQTYINTNLSWDGSQYHVEINGEKTENTYSASNQLLTTVGYYYANDMFVEDEKFEYTYNTTYPSAVETEYAYSWNGTNSTWKKESKGVLTSNFEVTRDEMILPFGDEGESREVKMYFSYMATELLLYQWSVTANDWLEDSKVNVYFSQSEFSSVDDVNAPKAVVYPNPVSDFIAVRLNENSIANIRLFDLQGRKLYEAPVNNQSKIDLTGLANGVYFYQITKDKETVSGKLIKK